MVRPSRTMQPRERALDEMTTATGRCQCADATHSADPPSCL